ncbi:hypothetical protein [Streptomyces termitum]|uniref:hypothetical protein n=1 Tax=Streptomyces termitum TaxID=67368 RepID=UPI0033B085BB
MTDAVAGGADRILTAHGPAPPSRTTAEPSDIPVTGTYPVPSSATRSSPLPHARGVQDPGPEGNPAEGETS